MAYNTLILENFAGGLNVRDGSAVVSEHMCVDALNIDFAPLGAVRQRDGYAPLTTAPLTNRADSLTPFYRTGANTQLVAGCGTRLEAISTAGAVVASMTGLSGGPWGLIRYGQPNAERVYAGNGIDTVKRWDGVSWTSPTATVDGVGGQAMPKARYLAIDSTSNRMVAAGYTTASGGPGGALTSPSHVHFSEAGLPESWGTTPPNDNSVQLHPGDGEAIQGVVAWRGQVFVFKQTKFFVFFGESVAGSGSVQFNYHVVEAGIGAVSPRAIVAARDGVYFLARDGIYRTQGQEPELVSDLIAPIFQTGLPLPTYYANPGGVALDSAYITNTAMAWMAGRVYVAFTGTGAMSNNRIAVLDTRASGNGSPGWWTVWDIPAAALTPFRAGSTEELTFAYSSGAQHVGRQRTNLISDDGAAITSRWQSGWTDFGTSRQKTIRQSELYGNGSVTFTKYRNHELGGTGSRIVFPKDDLWNDASDPTDLWGDGTDPTDLWSTGASEHRQMVRSQAIRGYTFSTGLSNSELNKTWSVDRMVHHVRGLREPGLVAA